MIQPQPSFTFDSEQIQHVINHIPPTVREQYPAHIFEPVRIEIARELILKEYYKLFPMLEAMNFEQVSSSILYWLHGAGYELAPVTDFWNYIDGMMISLKLKDIVPAITSAHVTWALEELDVHHLQLGWPVGNLAEHGPPPYTFDFINQRVLQNVQQLVINRRISDEKSSDTVVPRDHYPIIVQKNTDGTFKLLDGNRRILRAMLYGKQTITAWVGTITAEPRLQDHWVNTGFLRRLLAEYADDPSDEVRQSVRSQLRILFNSSSIARHHYQQRCVTHFPFAAELAKGI